MLKDMLITLAAFAGLGYLMKHIMAATIGLSLGVAHSYGWFTLPESTESTETWLWIGVMLGAAYLAAFQLLYRELKRRGVFPFAD